MRWGKVQDTRRKYKETEKERIAKSNKKNKTKQKVQNNFVKCMKNH
jgi:hypothetical protein